MNLRFNKAGITVLTMDPCPRVINAINYRGVIGFGSGELDPNGGVPNTRYPDNFVRVWFPYTAFIFRYVKVPGGFMYGGVGDQSMRVVVSNQPFSSFEDKCYASPTEHYPNSYACTDHRYDGAIFPNAYSLVSTMLNVWWNSQQLVVFPTVKKTAIQTWAKKNRDSILKVSWTPIGLINDYHLNIANVAKYNDITTNWINQPIKLNRKSKSAKLNPTMALFNA